MASAGLAKRAAKLFSVLAVGLLVWPLIGHEFSAGFQGLASTAFDGHEFGTGGYVRFLPREHTRSTVDRDESWNTGAELRIDGVEKRNSVLLNPRRLAYLPFVFLAGILAAMGLPHRRALLAFGLGSVLLCFVALGSVWLVVAWLFARVPGLVYTLAGWQEALLRLLYEAFVTPIANKFIIAMVVAGVCAQVVKFGLERRSMPQAVANSAPPRAPSRSRSRRDRKRARRT
jgi:hypothetical protein